jgi:hypothetical protein
MADVLGDQQFAVMGTSRWQTACAGLRSLASDRCVAVAVVSSVGPWAPLEGLGLSRYRGGKKATRSNSGAALEGENQLRGLLVLWREI